MFQVASIHTLKIPSCKRDFYSHSGSLNTNQLLDSLTCLSFEEAGHTWAKKTIELLTGMNEERKMLIAAGMDGFPSELIQAYEEAYQELIVEGREENRKTKHRYARQDAATLLNRLEKYSHNHLLFLHDFNVYFDDNMSARDLRKVKNRQKMAGGF